MSTMTVAVFGGTGLTGAAVADALHDRGATALRLSRSDVELGVQSVAAADVGYLIAPNMHPDEPSLIAQHLDLLREAEVSRVVYHSVVAPYAPRMKHHLSKAMSEDLIRRSGLDWTILQPCAYVQNFLPNDQDEIRIPFRVEAPFGMVDLLDVGEAGAAVCLDTSHSGATYELGGPQVVTVADLARAASDVLRRPVTAIAEPSAAWADRHRVGMNDLTLQMFTDMWDYYDAYGLLSGGRSLSFLLGRPSHSIEDVFARLYGSPN